MTETHGAGQVLLDGLGPLSTLPWRAQMQVMLRLMERVALTMSEDLAVIPRAQQVRWFQRRQERLGALGQISETDGDFHWPSGADPLFSWLLDAGRIWDEAVQLAESGSDTRTVLLCCRSLLNSLFRDPRINSLQVRILAAGDIDLLAFFCANERCSPDGPLPQSVSGNLPPVFALTLVTPDPGPEQYR